MEEQKIIAINGAKVNDEDRLALARLLIKFGYTVRLGKEKKEGAKASTLFVAYSS
jgi:hypothetical protein